MKDTLRPRLDMLRAVLHHFDEHPAAWAGKSRIAHNVGLLRTVLADLDAAATAQTAADPEGLTEDKAAARDAAEILLADLSAGATAHALETDDADLRVAVDFSLSDWDRMAEADFFAQAEATLARIEAEADALAEVDVTKGEVAAARAAVTAARPVTAARDNVVADRMVATSALGSGYGAAVTPLRVLGLLVPRQIKDAAFVAEYRNVRRVRG